MKHRQWLSYTIGTLFLVCTAVAGAGEETQERVEEQQDREQEIAERLDRLERMVDAQNQLALMQRLREVEEQIRTLRGAIEEQQHLVDRLEARQRDLYADLDDRLRRLAESEGPSPEADRDTLPIVDLPSEAADPDAADSEAQALVAMYRRGFNRLQDRDYAAAEGDFQAFLEGAEGHDLESNAWYWLGESHYARRDFASALAAFERVVEEFPDTEKAPDAQLKIGFVYYEQSEWGQAREALEQVLADHPDATASRLAQNRLRRMDDEGV